MYLQYTTWNKIIDTYADLDAIISTRGLCSYIAQLSNDDVSPIGGEGNSQTKHGYIVLEYLLIY